MKGYSGLIFEGNQCMGEKVSTGSYKREQMRENVCVNGGVEAIDLHFWRP